MLLFSATSYEHFLHTWEANVIFVLDSVDLQPFQEPATCGLHLFLFDDTSDHGLILVQLLL